MKNKKLINYYEALKVLKKKGMSQKQFHQAMEKGEIKINAKHPISGQILPYRITEIKEDGTIVGDFIQ